MLWKGGVLTSVGAVAVWWIAVALACPLSAHGTTVVNAADLRAVYGHAEPDGDTTSRTTKKGSKKTSPTIKPTRTPIVKPSPPVPVSYVAAAAEIGTAASAATIVAAVARAAGLQAQIITFPENGPFVCNSTLTVCPNPADGTVVTLPRPDPAQDLSGLCPEDPIRMTGSFSFASYHCLAQLAKHYQMYIAISMLDMQPCILTSTTSSSSSIAAPYNVTNLCQRTIDTGVLVYVFNTIAAKYYIKPCLGARRMHMYRVWCRD